jgi:glycosyltransferase involved in cell wall biosynthesis
MRILQTNKAYAPHVGGVETTVTILAEGLTARNGLDVQVLVCNPRRSLTLRTCKINGVTVTYAPRWGSVASLPISPSFLPQLARMHGDILHVHEPFPLVDLSLALFPRIRRQFRKIVVTWHSDIVRQRWALSLYRPFIERFLPLVDRILVSSPALIENSDFLRPYRDRCEVIPLGVDLRWTHNRATRAHRVDEIRKLTGTPLVLFVGRLVYYKGLQYLIEAVNSLADAKLVIIGSGPLKAQVDAQVAALGLGDRVTILPHLANEELYAYYEACDLLVLPSTERSEAYGLVQIEAMASGKPVVSTDIKTGTTFVNCNGVTGLTVPPRDAPALARAVNEILHNDDLRMRLGRQAQERALRDFTAEKMVERTLDLYTRLLATSPENPNV